MTIAELRQHQILVQDPVSIWPKYARLLARLKYLDEPYSGMGAETPQELVRYSEKHNEWQPSNVAAKDMPTIPFDQFMNLQIEK